MIKNIEQARKVQQTRVQNGKRGFAKAVRRFLLKRHAENYQQEKNKLPVQWLDKQQAA